ncbi:putative 2-heptaprenyl-naphthoquinone [Phaeomoniella chlamydospora]|uniref:Putative 2-heptaprenyl-naphthoquinone n=1 Tax=Phaeomoniella chlamydospora TaxID=158046 RepID=A0A0G2H100_PHACM|nr:putative 2-heptaprenyl-naphthoquinone [Phaeomoniella chlamydospora]
MSSKPSDINQYAQTGFANASSYDKHRPTYPPESVSHLLSAVEVSGKQGATIIDLAAGTGKFTELLAQRPENYNIIAVEPHDGMRDQLIAKQLRNVKVVKGMAEDMSEIQNESVEGVIASQSFHWFATLEALEEIYRVVRPAGVLGMIWNIECYNSPKHWDAPSSWESKLRDLVWEFDDGAARFRHEKWKKVFDDQLESTPWRVIKTADPMFSLPIGEERFPFETWLSKEDIWNRYYTLSQIAVLEGAELDRVKKAVTDALNAEDVKLNEEGKLPVRGYTVVSWTSKIPGRPLREGG